MPSFHWWCSYKGGGQEEDSQLVRTNHHLRVAFLQRAPRCLGQVRTAAHAQKTEANSVKYSQIWATAASLSAPALRQLPRHQEPGQLAVIGRRPHVRLDVRHGVTSPCGICLPLAEHTNKQAHHI